MSLSPIAWRYSLPGAKCATKRVRVFKAEQVGGFIQLQHRIREVIPAPSGAWLQFFDHQLGGSADPNPGAPIDADHCVPSSVP